MRLSTLRVSSSRAGLVAAGAVFVAVLAAPVHLPTPGDASIENAAYAQSRRSKKNRAAAQEESGCDATCLNNQQLQTVSGGGAGGGMSGGGMSGGGMSGGGASGAGMSGGNMSGGGAMGSSRSGSAYRGGTGGQPRSEADAAEKGARVTR